VNLWWSIFVFVCGGRTLFDLKTEFFRWNFFYVQDFSFIEFFKIKIKSTRKEKKTRKFFWLDDTIIVKNNKNIFDFLESFLICITLTSPK
jgi:hypothetical protein